MKTGQQEQKLGKPSRGLLVAGLVSVLGNGLLCYAVWQALQVHGTFLPLMAADAVNVGVMSYLFWSRRASLAAGVGLGFILVFGAAGLTILTGSSL